MTRTASDRLQYLHNESRTDPGETLGGRDSRERSGNRIQHVVKITVRGYLKRESMRKLVAGLAYCIQSPFIT